MRGFAVAGLLCFFPIVLEAQNTWTPLPNGGLGYTTSYTTVGTFRCDPLGNGIVGGTCSASGNSLRLTSGSRILDLIYHPITAQITATSTPSIAPMGYMEFDFSGGGPFSFPTHLHGYQSMIFDFTLSGPGTVQWGYMNLQDGTNTLRRNCCSFYMNTMTQRTTTPPPPFDYSEVVYYNFSYPVIDPEDEFVSIDATVALIPEPTSFLLFATGLLGWFTATGIKRRRD